MVKLQSMWRVSSMLMPSLISWLTSPWPDRLSLNALPRSLREGQLLVSFCDYLCTGFLWLFAIWNAKEKCKAFYFLYMLYSIQTCRIWICKAFLNPHMQGSSQYLCCLAQFLLLSFFCPMNLNNFCSNSNCLSSSPISSACTAVADERLVKEHVIW